MRPTPRASLALSVLVLPLVLVAPVATLPGSAAAPVPVETELHTGAACRAGALALGPAPRHGGLLDPRRHLAGARPRSPTSRCSSAPARDGTWTDWVDLDGQSGDTPDDRVPDSSRITVREGTRPLWVGPSDGVEVRVEVHSGAAPADLRVDLVDPGTSPLDGTAGRRRAPSAVAEASEPQPSIVTRAEWGADESMKRACRATPAPRGSRSCTTPRRPTTTRRPRRRRRSAASTRTT